MVLTVIDGTPASNNLFPQRPSQRSNANASQQPTENHTRSGRLVKQPVQYGDKCLRHFSLLHDCNY